jgi:hypothetical protein
MSDAKRVAVIYGWAEGPWQSKKFVEVMKQSGLEATKDLINTDVIFAHSAGCYLVPKDTRASVVALSGLPYWPGRSLAGGVFRKLVREIKFHRRNQGLSWWLNKLLHNVWYIISRPLKTFYLVTKRNGANLPDGANHKVILIRASDDTLLHPNVMKILREATSYRFTKLNGAHDDCWFEPKPYIDLLLKEL